MGTVVTRREGPLCGGEELWVDFRYGSEESFVRFHIMYDQNRNFCFRVQQLSFYS